MLETLYATETCVSPGYFEEKHRMLYSKSHMTITENAKYPFLVKRAFRKMQFGGRAIFITMPSMVPTHPCNGFMNRLWYLNPSASALKNSSSVVIEGKDRRSRKTSSVLCKWFNIFAEGNLKQCIWSATLPHASMRSFIANQLMGGTRNAEERLAIYSSRETSAHTKCRSSSNESRSIR